jgi:hypothetical protein
VDVVNPAEAGIEEIPCAAPPECAGCGFRPPVIDAAQCKPALMHGI